MSRLLTAGDVARRFGIHRATAYRLMLDAHQKYGDAVVARRGRRLLTTEEAFAKVFPDAPLSRDERRLASLERRADEAERRADALARELVALKASVRAEQRDFWQRADRWFSEQREHRRDPSRCS